MCIYTKKIVR